jgi:hypothetical protein
MGQGLHGCATTTEAVRRAIQHGQEAMALAGGRRSRRPSENHARALRNTAWLCRAPKQPGGSAALTEVKFPLIQGAIGLC